MSMTTSRDSSLASFFSIARILRFCSRSSPKDALTYVLICLRAENDLSRWAVLTTIVIDIGQLTTWKAKGCIPFNSILKPAVSTRPFWIEGTILLSHPFWRIAKGHWIGLNRFFIRPWSDIWYIWWWTWKWLFLWHTFYLNCKQDNWNKSLVEYQHYTAIYKYTHACILTSVALTRKCSTRVTKYCKWCCGITEWLAQYHGCLTNQDPWYRVCI